MKNLSFLLLAMIYTPSAFAATPGCPEPAQRHLRQAKQLVVVTTETWNDSKAELARFERPDSKAAFSAVGTPEAAIVGRAGLAWGHRFASLATANGGGVKREGDGRTPAGVFRLGRKFGFESGETPERLHLKESTECVDDPNSQYYNRIVDATAVKLDWKSSEKMRAIDVYKIGLVVDYESSAKDRAGSCIFVHIAKPGDKGTAGCLAFRESGVAALLKWLRKDSNAAIAFLPKSELEKWRSCFPEVGKIPVGFPSQGGATRSQPGGK